MRNIFLYNYNKKDINHFTTPFGLSVRRKIDKAFKKVCNVFTNVNIIRPTNKVQCSNDDYFNNVSLDYIEPSSYNLSKKKHNIILERYPELNPDEPYIFVSNHSCPEDIETILNVIDRNAYLVLGSIDSLNYNKEMYLLWLNGMIPFDILDKEERAGLMPKMEKVINTNSILIFPEGSHNYSPNKLINNLYDGPINLSLKTGRKIVLVSLLRDEENNSTYIDVSNPIDSSKVVINLDDYYPNEEHNEKYYVKSLSSYLRDQMATQIYTLMSRHSKVVKRKEDDHLEETTRMEKVVDAFKKLHWNKDVFEAEYLTKKTKEELEYEDVHESINNLLKVKSKRPLFVNYRDFIRRYTDIHDKDVVEAMRRHLEKVRTK